MRKMRVEVVGTGCATCQQLHQITKVVAAEIDPDISVDYISGQDGMKRLMALGLMQSPALVINGKVVMMGYNSNTEKIKSLILENA